MKTKKIVKSLLTSLLIFAILSSLTVSAGNLVTSNDSGNYIDFTISGSELVVSGKLRYDGLDTIVFRYGGQTVPFAASSSQYFQYKLSLSSITERTLLSVFTRKSGDTVCYSYILNLVAIEPSSGGYRIVSSPVLASNMNIANEWLNPADTLGGTISDSVKKASGEIASSGQSDYNKVFSLYKWVVNNIAYDWDYYTGKKSTVSEKPYEVLSSRTAVCSGYANLLKELIQAQGIPAITVETYTAAKSGSGSFLSSDYSSKTANHLIVEAYVDGRWILLDPTWDSNNTYENGRITYQAPTGYLYFDISIELISMTHKFIDRPTTQNADNIPSVWAKSDVGGAISKGFVPYWLQSSYRSGITRLQYATMLIEMLKERNGCSSINEMLKNFGKSMTGTTLSDTDNRCSTAAVVLGLMDTVDGKFLPDSEVTTEEAQSIAKKIVSLLGISASNIVDSIINVTSAKTASPANADSGIKTAADTEIGAQSMSQASVCTREQAAVTLYQIMTLKK